MAHISSAVNRWFSSIKVSNSDSALPNSRSSSASIFSLDLMPKKFLSTSWFESGSKSSSDGTVYRPVFLNVIIHFLLQQFCDFEDFFYALRCQPHQLI